MGVKKLSFNSFVSTRKDSRLQLIEFTKKGFYCRQGDFYIDPWRPVKNALITHAHSDHARYGHKYYLSHHDSIPVMQLRLGNNHYEGVDFGEVRNINGVNVSFHPAGHIIGSAQIRVEYKGEVWVASGDYKIENDGLSPAFEPVKCHTFITESTFGLPIYQWNSQQQLFDEINAWWRHNQERDIASVLCAYSLGKAQRILYNLDQSIGPIYLHGTIFNMNKALVNAGMPIPDVPRADTGLKKDAFRKAMIIAPPSAAGSAWLRRFAPVSLGVASGWMAIRGTKRRRAADKGFALSDHADWKGLNDAVRETGAERIFVTHGYSSQFSRWLCDLGYDAKPVETMFEGESAEILETDQAEEEKLADNTIAEE